ncbi:MAG: TusE/DsrC/DsvC family sulfur relay protein, partial [Desulfobacterales bacterium]
MPTVEFMGKAFTVDEDGFIDSYENWSQEWVQWVKKEEGIDELNEEHQKVIKVLREYYEKNGIAPMVRVLSKVTGFKLKHIYELFPSGPGKGACKMAGIPSRPVVSDPIHRNDTMTSMKTRPCAPRRAF